VYVLQAVDRLRADEPELAARLEVHLAGVLTDVDLLHARSPAVRLHGYLSHADTLELLRTADALFLPMQDLPPGTRATIVPGKTYEYLAAGRPILAAVPEGDARDILRDAGAAWLCRPADVDEMISILRVALVAHRAGERQPAPRPEVVERFEYRRLAGELAAVFDGVDRRSPVADIESRGAWRALDRDGDAVQA
jgi:glycosyltransferase involved in cell wall biosynthesis